jgi:dUTP pyrophosphatase
MHKVETISLLKLKNGLDLPIPSYATHCSAGVDLVAAITEDVILPSGEFMVIPAGIAIALPEGFEAQIRPRSGLAAKYGVTVLNSPGTIDSDYRGEIGVVLINHGKNDYTITRGLRIAQMVITRYTQVSFHEVESLDDTARGAGGFGSTGV